MKHDPDYQRGLDELRKNHPNLAVECDAFAGVSDVLTWMQKTGRAQAAVDIVAQDEFEYDFLIQLKPDGDWIAFGIT